MISFNWMDHLYKTSTNAENNNSADIDELKIKTIYVDKGTILKRIRARAKGRTGKIMKPTCHITVTVGN